MKRISILLSCFRADDLIEAYIDALLPSQITAIANLVAIDFPFSHNNPVHVEKVLRRYPDLTLIRKHHNVSLYDAWNQAVGLAETDYVSNLNLDDRVAPHYYALAAESLDLQQADVFSSQSITTSTIGEWSAGSTPQQHLPSERFDGSSIMHYHLEDLVFSSGGRVQKRNLPHCAPVWRRSLHGALGWFDSRAYDFCADFEFWLRVAAADKAMLLHRDPLTLFYCAKGTASDRLMHLETAAVVDRWRPAWPPSAYRPTHLGEQHDLLHYCLNLNAIFSSPLYYSHLGELHLIDPRLEDILHHENGQSSPEQLPQTPLISVIMPVFNAVGYIHDAVDSVFSQGIDDIELLLIDDSSTDGSLALARQLAGRNDRIRVLQNNRLKGVSGARNTGLANASGKYIAFLDADDQYADGALMARLDYLLTHPGAQLVHGPARLVDEQNNDLAAPISIPRDVTFADAFTNPTHLNTVLGAQTLLRAFAFREGMTNGEDWLYFAQLLRSGAVSHYVEAGGATYRIHGASTVLQNMERHENLVREVIDWVYSDVPDTPDSQVAPQYRLGLATPPACTVRCRRDFSLFLWGLLDSNLSLCRRLLDKPEFLDFLRALNVSSIPASLRTPFSRKYRVPIERASSALSIERKREVSSTCIALNLATLAPTLYEAIARTLFLSSPSIVDTPYLTLPAEAITPQAADTLYPDIFPQRIAVVMGNGPSAGLVDFSLLKLGHISSVGMNAAYRYWDRIDFRPDYYICMDTVVIRSHAKRIVELVTEGRIKRFFLRDDLKELHPDLTNHPRILWFTQARELGGLFATNFITTGSWAIRWMIHQGMALIGTIGIDANYVELLPEAVRVGQEGDLRLRVAKTPTFNPNYFFSDYQLEGDEYNVPNDPSYRKNMGGLVHVDALRKVAEDLTTYEAPARVIDCSPISSHGVFPKYSLSTFLDRTRLKLVTSFRATGEPASLLNYIRVLEANCANPFIGVVSLLLEGTLQDLEQQIDEEASQSLRSLTAAGKLALNLIVGRPTYKQILDHANTLGQGMVAVLNADILVTADAAQKLVLDRFPLKNQIYALTRWNRTDAGDFVQAMKSSPPWSQLAPEELGSNERNFFSYDCYVYEAPLYVPEALDTVLIGSYGCDTAIAAIFRAAGFSVANPCLEIKCIHIDEIQRTYDGESGQADLARNVLAVDQQLLRRYRKGSIPPSESLAFPALRRNTAWLGGPKTRDVSHSLFRALGATPWISLGEIASCPHLKIAVSDGDLNSEAEAILDLPRRVSEDNVFIEWELAGFSQAIHISDILVAHEQFKSVGLLLYHYQWQAMIHLDHSPDDVKTSFNELMLLVRDVLHPPCFLAGHPGAPSGSDSRVTLNPGIVVGDRFRRLGPTRWAFDIRKADSGRYWQAVVTQSIYSGDGYVACLLLSSDVSIDVRVSVARNGGSPYEGTSELVALRSGRSPVEVLCKHIFTSRHFGLKVQLEPVVADALSAELEVQLLFLAQCTSGERVVTCGGGTVIGPFLRARGACCDETSAVAALLTNAPSGSTMINVGADDEQRFTAFRDQGWKISSFYSDPQSRVTRLERWAKHERGSIVIPDARFLKNSLEKKGFASLRGGQSSEPDGPSAASMSHTDAQKDGVATLGQLLQDSAPSTVDFLRVAAEGLALSVLLGFPWDRFAPAVVECDFQDAKTKPLGYSYDDLCRFLIDKGYKIYLSEWHPNAQGTVAREWLRLVSYPCDLADARAWGKLLAFRDHIEEDALAEAVQKTLRFRADEKQQVAAGSVNRGVVPRLGAPSLIAEGRRGFHVNPGLHFVAAGTDEWRYDHSDATQRIWIAAMDSPSPTEGRTFVGSLRVAASRAMTVGVSLGRHGITEYEGAAKRILLAPGVAYSVHLSHRFQRTHAALKLQLEVIDLPGGGSALLRIDGLGIAESLASVRHRLGIEMLDFPMANRLFREADYAAALPVYVWLDQQRPLPMYGRSAVTAANLLGMSWVTSVKDLNWLSV